MASKLCWEDTTSYPRSHKGERTPKTLTLVCPYFRVAVTCDHINFPGEWVLSSSDLGCRDGRRIPGCGNGEQAKKFAIKKLQEWAKEVQHYTDAAAKL